MIADNALKNGYTDIRFLDDQATGMCMDFPIIGVTGDIQSFDDGKTDFLIAIGNNAVRKQIAEKYCVNWVSLVHPSAQVGVHVSIGKGTVVMAGAILNPCSVIGEHCIINTGAIVEHDNVISDYVHLSPGTKLSGMVTVGEGTWIGTGASVVNNIEICDHVVIGAGSVVIRNIRTKGTYVGVVSRDNGNRR